MPGIKEFKKGKYYVWDGPKKGIKNGLQGWSDYMEEMADGKPRKCLEASGYIAEFKGIQGGVWNWTGADKYMTELGVTKFEVGKWYRWRGPKERPANWNPNGMMNEMLSGRPFLCVSAESSSLRATFKGIPSNDNDHWSWAEANKYMEEVSFSSLPDDLLHAIDSSGAKPYWEITLPEGILKGERLIDISSRRSRPRVNPSKYAVSVNISA